MRRIIDPCLFLDRSFCRNPLGLRYACAVVVFGASLVANLGCSRGDKWEMIPVQGTVSRSKTPLANVRVIFLPDGSAGTKSPQISGLTDAAGRYDLYSDAGVRGAPIGHYRVCIASTRNEINLEGVNPEGNFAKALKEEGKKSPQVPQKYQMFETTPLRVEVKPGGAQTLDFDVPEVARRRKRGGS